MKYPKDLRVNNKGNDMPTYEYRCLKCDKTFDEFQSIKANPLKNCKYCSGKVERVIGMGGGFILKGSGFYSTDYRKPDYKEKEKKEKERKDKPVSCPASKSKDCKNCPMTEK